MFENALYPGIRDALTSLAQDGHHLYVVTAKPTVYATRILQHFAVDRFFRGVYGPEMGQRLFDKASLVAAAQKASGIPSASASLVGDRADDVAAARANGVHAIGATWGYGGREELALAGADVLVHSAEECVSHIRGLRG
jgi:phosphoglycolate phosphatase